tara:strand:- start:201 stop:1403 length:1203 start_codon:yes stop_codon:yes gene_type:complete
MAVTESITKQMSLLPEYQEKYLKDLMANVFQFDEETGEVTGFAAQSPLYGTPVMDPETGEQMYEGLDGVYTSDPAQAALDQYGEPIFAVEGGVAAPDVIGFTDMQIEAFNRLVGGVDPVTGEQYDSVIDSYKPFFEESKEIYGKGVAAADDSMGIYDPRGQVVYDTDPSTGERVARLDAEGNEVRSGGYKDYYDPFVDDVVLAAQRDNDEALERERRRIGAEAAQFGAFGTRRDLIEGEAIGRSAAESGRLGSELRSAAYTGAQTQAQSAFENQQNRNQSAATLFQNLGTGIGALGEATSAAGLKDVNSLFNTGLLEQTQLQAEYDVQRAGQLEEAYEPFARFSYMRDILSGVPASGTSLVAAGTPSASTAGGILSTANSYIAGGGGTPILGGITNVSGA